MCATRQVGKATLTKGDYPDAVLFDERDGLYWLESLNLIRFEETTGAHFDCERVGFDTCEAMAHVVRLLERGIKVGLRQGDRVRMLSRRRPHRPAPPAGTSLLLAPELLIDRRELAAMRQSMSRKHWRLRDSLEAWRSLLCQGPQSTGRELPTLYVYEMAAGVYEVDWELTTLQEASFQTFALACDLAGERISCRLVPPRSAGHKPARSAKAIVMQPPVTFGQLRLAI